MLKGRKSAKVQEGISEYLTPLPDWMGPSLDSWEERGDAPWTKKEGVFLHRLPDSRLKLPQDYKKSVKWAVSIGGRFLKAFFTKMEAEDFIREKSSFKK